MIVKGDVGIDVSHWQGVIDWAAVKAAGVDWVSAKVTQGDSYVDPNGRHNLAAAEAAGLVAVGYHFADPAPAMSVASAAAEAARYLAHHPGGPFVLDWESTKARSLETLSPEKQIKWIVLWAARCRIDPATRDVPVVVYCDPAIAHRLATAAREWGYDLPFLWLAHWVGEADESPTDVTRYSWDGSPWQYTAWGCPVWWQWNARGSLAGVAGGVDMDVALVDLAWNKEDK